MSQPEQHADLVFSCIHQQSTEYSLLWRQQHKYMGDSDYMYQQSLLFEPIANVQSTTSRLFGYFKGSIICFRPKYYPPFSGTKPKASSTQVLNSCYIRTVPACNRGYMYDKKNTNYSW